MKLLVMSILSLFSVSCFAESGILILAHGSMKMHHHGKCHNNNPTQWEKAVLDARKSISKRLPHISDVAFGMWSTKCVEAGITRLENKLKNSGKKLEHLIVLPLFISSDSAVIEMQKYIFKKRKDKVIPIPHVSQTSFTGKISYLLAIDYHPTVSIILAKRLQELIHKAKSEGYSEDEMNLVLVMHGPVGDKDNEKWLEFSKKYLRDLMYLFPLKQANVVSLRDDASDEVRNKATLKLRGLVSGATRAGNKSLVLPLLLSKGGIEKGILERLVGLDYIWTGNMLLPDTMLENFLIQRLK